MRSILNALQDGRLFELPENGKDRALEFLARILDANPDIEVGTDAIEEIQRREQQCNTGIGAGVAVPHIRARREEGELFCAIGWTAAGIDYGAADHGHVHLVFMYYIPGAHKNVYLKEISSLVKAIRRSGGIEPIAHAANLGDVRHLLLDWISAVLGDSGPEAVARMIRLESKQAQTPPPPAPVPVPPTPAGPASSPTPPAPPARRLAARLFAFQVVLAPPAPPILLSPDPDWNPEAEKDAELGRRLAAGTPFTLAGLEVHLVASRTYAGNRQVFDCIALAPAAP